MLVLMLILALALNVSAEVTYETLDAEFPGVGFTVITGAIPGTITGVYTDVFGSNHSFFQEERKAPQVLLRVVAQDISLAGITGFFRDSAATPEGLIFTRGFIYHEGNFQSLIGPNVASQPRNIAFSTLVEPIAINDIGQVCGDYRHPANKFLGFFYDPNSPSPYITFDLPGAESTTCLGLSQAPNPVFLLRGSIGGQIKHYLLDSRGLNELTIPGFPNAGIVAFNGHRLAGNIGNVGFFYDGDTVQEIEVPGARLTDLQGLLVERNRVKVYGRYILESDNTHHGFKATLGAPSQRRIARVSTKTTARIAMADCSDNSKRHECIQSRRAK